MAGLGEYNKALRMRDLIANMIKDQIDTLRPKYQYATVVSIDRVNRKCEVQFTGDTATVNVLMGSIQPSAVGQVVRVNGLRGDRFIEDVMGLPWMGNAAGDVEIDHGITNTDATSPQLILRLIEAGVDVNTLTMLASGVIAASGTLQAQTLKSDSTTDVGLTGEAFEQLIYMQRIRSQSITGGGVRKASSTGIGWTQRLICISQGRGANTAVSGYFDINMPPDGTVITKYGVTAATTVTVASGEIPMIAFDALYYELPLGSTFTGQDGNFRIVSYTADFQIPNNWILICIKSSVTDSTHYVWGDRRVQHWWTGVTFENSWVNYNSTTALKPQYKKENGRVYLRGLAKNGTVATDSTGNIFTLPVAFRPLLTYPFATIAGDALARCDVLPTGEVRAMFGANTYFSLDGISFDAEQ